MPQAISLPRRGTRRQWVLILPPIVLLALVFCYGVIAKARHADKRAASNAHSVGTDAGLAGRYSHRDRDREEAAQIPNDVREIQSRSGKAPGNVSSSAFQTALAATRQLPPSPLGQERKFVSARTTGNWSLVAYSPIANDFGGGASSRIDCIAVDPTNANIVFAGSEGGISRSTDGGVHWSYVSDNIDSQSIKCLAVDPVYPAIVYAGTGTRDLFATGIYWSTDGGTTWSLRNEIDFYGKTVAKLVVDPATAGSTTSTTMYASVISYVNDSNNSHSVWKSTDSGLSWTQLRSAPGVTYGGNIERFYDIVLDPDNSSTLFVTAPDGVFKYAYSGGRFGGYVWTKIHDIPNGTLPSYLAFAQSVLYLAYNNGDAVIIKSTDKGATWSAPLPSSGAGLSCFGVDPAHPERIFVGSAPLRYSLDGGTHWISPTTVHPDIHSIAFCPTNDHRYYLGNDGGIYRADYTGGSTINFVPKNSYLVGSLMRGVSLSSDGSMVMGNQDNGTQFHFATDFDPPWMMLQGGDGYQPKIDPNNANKLYYQVYSYGNLVCNNGWQSVRRVLNGVTTDITPGVACNERSAGFSALFVNSTDAARVIVGFKNIYRSADSGGTWTRIGPDGIDTDPDGSAFALAEAPSDTNVIYAVFDRLRVFVTSNANLGTAATWTQVINGYEGVGLISGITVDPTDPNTAYITSETNVWKTVNRGPHWDPVGYANLIYRDVVIDPADHLHVFVGGTAGVFASTNGGSTWGTYAGIPYGLEVTSLSLNATSRRLAASTYGRGVYMLDLSP
jgi:photosystem II stability/assembly factor-like uncharacterized protein